LILFVLFFCSLILSVSCKINEVTSNSGSNPATADSSYTVTLSGLKNQSVYLVKMNNSQTVAAASATGSAASSVLSSDISGRTVIDYRNLDSDTIGENVSGVFKVPKGTVVRLENKKAQEALTHPPAASVIGQASSRSIQNAQSARNSSSLQATLSVGLSTRKFLVAIDANESSYVTITATLRGSSAHAQVWVASANDASGSPTASDTVTAVTAQSIADTFTKIYPVETAIFGYEYGGDPGDTAHAGGMDGEIPINILIYDVDYDTAQVSTSGSGVVGFFYDKDNLPLGTSNSNASEIFYIDSWFTVKYPGVVYSTLVHEFQHMIGYNEKYKQKTNSGEMSAWYTEMLSQVAEDMMSTDLETWLGAKYNVADDGPVNNRMQWFDYLAGYSVAGVTDWLTSSDDEKQSSYASTFAFGSYLARNYGGAPLIKAIASNDSVNDASVTAALAALGRSEVTFRDAFARYGEALIYSSSGFSDGIVPSNYNTFDRSASDTINGHVYSFSAFDIWKIPVTYKDNTTGIMSPKTYPIGVNNSIRPHGVYLQTTSAWKNKTGELVITLKKPTNPDVSLALMIRAAQ